MESSSLLLICAVSFFMVFLILVLLALVMRLIIFLFPERKTATDLTVIAAITATVQTIFPGTNVTNIEEKP